MESQTLTLSNADNSHAYKVTEVEGGGEAEVGQYMQNIKYKGRTAKFITKTPCCRCLMILQLRSGL